jgi:glutathione S-transferase
VDLHGLGSSLLEVTDPLEATEMMILRSSPASPFGRKVKIVAFELGLMDRIRIEVADTTNPTDSLRGQNPLGKIPVLVLEDGAILYDSRVIAEFLDQLGGGGKIFPRNSSRWAVLTQAALADGIMDAALLLRYEHTLRAETGRNPGWVANQQSKIDRGLAVLEADPPGLASPPDIGQIGVACALGYLDLRFEGKWRSGHPKLVAWLDRFAAAVPAFAETKVAA